MAAGTGRTVRREMTDAYAQLEEKILERDQVGASHIFYNLVRAGRPLPEVHWAQQVPLPSTAPSRRSSTPG